MLDGRDHPGTLGADNPEAARVHHNTGPTMAMLTSPVDGALIKTPRRPFHRTRRGIIIITVAFVTIVAVIVGGAVGGTLSSYSRPPSPSNTAVAQGTGGVYTTSSSQAGGLPTASSLTTLIRSGGVPTSV